MAPNIVAKYCAKNDYLLTAPLDNVEKKIQILLDYNIKPISILKCLYALDRADHVYVSRLERLLSFNVNDVKIWFFKCADDVFEKYLYSLPMSNPNRVDKIESHNCKQIRIMNQLNDILDCSKEEAAKIYYNQIRHFDQMDTAKTNIEYLRKNGIDSVLITNVSEVLTMQSGLFFI